MNERKIPTLLGIVLLLVLEAIGIVLLLFTILISGTIIQPIVFLIPLVVVWYTSHPLTHFLFALRFNVGVLYFYIGRSELVKSNNAIIRRAAPLLITIGTKLDNSKMALTPPTIRAWIYGSSPLVGLVLIAIIESFAILYPKFNIFSPVLGGLFFLVTLGTELILGTRYGDLSKMKREFSKLK